MATPYFQLRFDHVPSTQDIAREEIDDLPLLVIAASQTVGRGRTGSDWLNADRALAVSIAFRHDPDDVRPSSLLAGVAATRAIPEVSLKWPNDVQRNGSKVGGILVERSAEITVVGMGVNLWWPDPIDGAGAIFDTDPGAEAHAEIGAIWGAELMDIMDRDGWPADEYREACQTLGQRIAWQPEGRGRAVEVGEDGGLVVETETGRATIYSGEVRHVRQV